MSDKLKAGLVLLSVLCATGLAQATSIHINEIHYDNTGTDSGEFIELAGNAGAVLDGWSLVLYNGADGDPYNSLPLNGVLDDDTGTGYGFAVIDLPTNGLQNGTADGIALLDGAGLLIEFISYEGVLTALDGPAVGQTSVDIGVSESNSTPLGWSLQLSGVGSLTGDLVWQPAQVATPGALNSGQVLLSEMALPTSTSLLLTGLAVMLRWRPRLF